MTRPCEVAAAGTPRVLVVDADPALLGLLEEWLTDYGCRVQGGDGPWHNGFDLVVVDVPFPRSGLDALKRVAVQHPGAPILALSSSFFAGIASTGAVAHTLGVAGVLPKPVTRAALIAAVHRVLHPAK